MPFDKARVRHFSLAALLAGLAQAAPNPPPAQVVQQYCVGCHNAKLKTANLVLDNIANDAVGLHPETWEKVVRRLRVRSMPPANLPRPDEATYTATIATLESSLDAAAAARLNPGRTETFRRLNRTEYQNAIRDLLALDIDATALLPADDAGHGFDNVTVQNLSPTLLERYVSASGKISRLALGRPVRGPGGDTFNLPPDLTQEQQFDDLPLGTRGGLALRYTFPVNGEYEFQIRLARDRNEHVEGLSGTHDVELILDGQRVRLFTVKPPPRGNDDHVVDQDLNARVAVNAGPHMIAATFPKQTANLLETERQPYQAHFNMDRHPRIQPAVFSLTVNGPYSPRGAGDTPSRKRILVCTPPAQAAEAEENACAQRIISTLLRRAYRRPVGNDDLSTPMRFYREGRAAGGFEAGVESALRAILVSPEFVFRVEQDPPGVEPGAAYRISDLELASRLSFFLWSSLPDDELLDAATRGDLHSSAGLERQTRRMLADSRAHALVTNFASQWLYLPNLAGINPDMRIFPGFDDNLRRAFRTETEMFVDSIIREDRNILDLIGANYTFLNERLAKHYGIPNVYGSQFRRVTFDAESHRGGLLRQGSILTVTSYATRTSPVIRGKWILSNLMGVPPPPPLPSVPALKEDHAVGKAVSMRDRMSAHRANPVCAGCHQLMDPVGFAMENYDAIGRWRTAEEGTPIDASGGLPDGSKFSGVDGLEAALLGRPEVFAGTFTEKLMTYALGRGVETYDAPAVRAILRSARANDYRFSSVIIGIVNSTPFQMRAAQPAPVSAGTRRSL